MHARLERQARLHAGRDARHCQPIIGRGDQRFSLAGSPGVVREVPEDSVVRAGSVDPAVGEAWTPAQDRALAPDDLAGKVAATLRHS